jgi:hypothetical protein
MLQSKTGIAISPADIKYAIDQYMGGSGRAVSKTVNMVNDIGSGKFSMPEEYPFLSRFYRKRTEEEVGFGAGGEIPEIKKRLESQARESFKANNEAEQLYKEWKALPPEEASAKFEALSNSDPTLAKKIVDVAESDALGLTYQDKLVKALQVNNGERAQYIVEKFNELDSDEEKAALWEDYVSKKLITENIAQQIQYLLANPSAK